MNDRPDESLEPELRELIADYGAPPRPLDAQRRDAIFARVQAQRGAARNGRPDSRPIARSAAPRRRRIRLAPWIAAAAVLVVGIGIGRMLPQESSAPPTQTAAQQDGARFSQETSEALYLLATRDYLSRTATLLTEFRQAAPQPTPELEMTPGNGTVRWAGDLLLETRLLLDSPAGDDARLSNLLRDLELILAEIVQLSDTTNPHERELLRKSLEERSVFLRLQQEIPARKGTRGV